MGTSLGESLPLYIFVRSSLRDSQLHERNLQLHLPPCKKEKLWFRVRQTTHKEVSDSRTQVRLEEPSEDY